MMKKCEDATYKQREKEKNLESKRQERADPCMKEKDSEYKRKKRKASEVKEKEAEFKRQK